MARLNLRKTNMRGFTGNMSGTHVDLKTGKISQKITFGEENKDKWIMDYGADKNTQKQRPSAATPEALKIDKK
jgi:hypothetical protein